MKIIYSYIPTIDNACPVSSKIFIEVNRLIEAWRYIKALRYTKLGKLFNDSIANAIESTTFAPGDIEANVPDFYEALEMNILADLESIFGLERGDLFEVELTAIRWYKLTCTLASTNDPDFFDSTATAGIVEVSSVTDECHRILADLIEDDRKRVLTDLESQKK